MAKLLFLCIENANRTQMAEAFAKIYGGDHVEVYSAGINPVEAVNPVAVEAMKELGYDISEQLPTFINELPDVEFDYVVNMGIGYEYTSIPAKNRLEWDLPNPKELDLKEYRKVRDLIEGNVKILVNKLEPAKD
ncbi:MAG: arsenate reductase ArsC [Bacteroidetes bacterium SW_10_40_5]|nr:MAG: arsenate reductase ArsC [Bacteroidetes bacterium SW_10_40_5]